MDGFGRYSCCLRSALGHSSTYAGCEIARAAANIQATRHRRIDLADNIQRPLVECAGRELPRHKWLEARAAGLSHGFEQFGGVAIAVVISEFGIPRGNKSRPTTLDFLLASTAVNKIGTVVFVFTA